MSAMNRRMLLGTSMAAAATGILPAKAWGADELVAAIYYGAWEEAYGQIVRAALMETHGVTLRLSPMWAVDQVARAAASRGNPPFDAFVLDPGPRIDAISRGVLKPFDADRLTNISNVPSAFVDDYGIGVSAQMVGILYNPERVAEPPTNWLDLLEGKFIGQVALSGFQTTFGTISLLEMNRALGGTIENLEPLFAAIKENLPHFAAVTAPAALSTLYQQGEADIFFHVYAEVPNMRSRGLSVDFAKPTTGTAMFHNTLHISDGARNVDAAYKYIDTVISADVQRSLQAPPYNFLSVNRTVDLANDFPASIIQSHEELDAMITYDWTEINKYRSEWIERFNREVAL